MSARDLILVGGGGHCRSCIDVIEQEGKWRIAGIVDRPEKVGERILGYPVIAGDEEIPRLARDYLFFLVTLGHIKGPARRREIFEQLKELGGELPTVVSPLAYVSPHAVVEEGTVVFHRATVNAGARIGRNGIVNSCALIEHDAAVDDHCHISTGAILNGGVRVAEGTFVGSGAVTRQGIAIGVGCIVGAGVTVLSDVPDGTVYTGRKPNE